MTRTPLFSPGSTDALANFLTTNHYPLSRSSNNLLIPGEFIVRPLKNADAAWLKDLLSGKEVSARLYKPARKPLRPAPRPVLSPLLHIRLIQLCQCCDYFLITVRGDKSIVRLLTENALISPGRDTEPRGASLEVLGQNRYAFSYPSTTESLQVSTSQTFLSQEEARRNFGLPAGLSQDSKSPKVAVIDTGFRLNNTGGMSVPLWQGGIGSPCQLTNDFVGWNFVGQPKIDMIRAGIQYDPTTGRIVNNFENNNPDDDCPCEHGTLLSAIISQTADRYHRAYLPEIMVLKAFDSEGVGSLFTVVCALCYAQAHEADVINASFVIPASKAIPLLKTCFDGLLESRIMVVCAAGNRGNAEEQSGVQLTNNLFPACLSATHKNVITVTSVWENGQGRENYSDQYVNVGVVATQQNPDARQRQGYFRAPYLWYKNSLPNTTDPALSADRNRGGIDRVGGSSFATAFFSGLVAGVLGQHHGLDQLSHRSNDFRHVLLKAIQESRWNDLAFPEGADGVVASNYYVQIP
ncbi:S8/S53 family peptidase [Larkinella harenae]